MKKAIKSTRFLILLAALLFPTLVQAQIKVNERVNSTWLEKTYSPPPLQIDRDQLIERFNNIYKNPVSIWVDRINNESVSKKFKVKALDDRLDEKKGTIFFYNDIITDRPIIVKTYIPLTDPLDPNKRYVPTVAIALSKAWGSPVPDMIRFWFSFNSNEDAIKFAEYMYYLLQPAINAQEEIIRAEMMADSIRFCTLASKYREMEVKPVVTEQQRKYIVQASSFTKDKIYISAIDAYKKAIAIDPVAYPAVYYNLAFLFAEKKDFKEAIKNMQKYLLLVPDAPDARAAQDKIYEWER